MEAAADLGWKGSKNSSGHRREAFQSVKQHLQECGGSSGNDKRVWLYRGRGTKRAWRAPPSPPPLPGRAAVAQAEASGWRRGRAREQPGAKEHCTLFACYKDSFCRGALSRVKLGQRAPESGRRQCGREIVRSELVDTIMTAFCHIVESASPSGSFHFALPAPTHQCPVRRQGSLGS